MLRFAFFMTVISFLCFVTAACEGNRKQDQIQAMKNGIYLIKHIDIETLFDKQNQLNMSGVEAFGQCISGNEISCSPFTKDGRPDIVTVSNKNMTVIYRSLIDAFAYEKKRNRGLQDQLRSLQNNNF